MPFTHNSAWHLSGNASQVGGGISTGASDITLVNTTIVNNYANAGGGGISLGGGIAKVKNSIVAKNISRPTLTGVFPNGVDLSNTPSNPFVSLGYNIIGADDGSYGFTNGVNGDIVGRSGTDYPYYTNPYFAPLANNGGPTATHALVPGSPAIDAVPAANCTVTTDQRGVARPAGAACDIGAYEAPVGGNIVLLPTSVRVASTVGTKPNPKLIADGATPGTPPSASSVSIQIGNTNGIPTTATSVYGVLTNISCNGGGNFRFWASTTVPDSVNLNIPGVLPSLNLSTNFNAPLDADGKVNLGLAGAANTTCGYAVDVIGYTTAANNGSALSLLPTSVRIASTFGANSNPRLTATGLKPSNPSDTSSVLIKAAGTNGIPQNATGIVGVVTNVGCTGGGNFRFWIGTSVPDAVNLNVPGALASLNLSTGFTAPLDSSGNVKLGLAGSSNITCGYAVDVVGYLAPPTTATGLTLLPVSARVATTLSTKGNPNLSASAVVPSNPVAASSIAIQVSGTNGIPAGAKGVVGVLTNIGCNGGGNFRFWTGTTVPDSVNLNVPGVLSTLNLSTGFVASLDAKGKVNLGLGSGAKVSCGYAVDIIGYF